MVTKLETTDKQEKAPQLYSLTALQRDANRFLGFTAQQTLDYTQSLYEKKLVTYPRTDSRFLTEDMEGRLPHLVDKLVWKFGYTRHVPVHAKQVIDNKKVSDHHAIIPTVNVADAEFGQLPSGEQKILSLITARFISALGDAAVRSETELEFTCADTVFKAITRKEACKLDDKLQEAIQYGNYHKRIAGLTTVEDCKDVLHRRFILLTRILRKVSIQNVKCRRKSPDISTDWTERGQNIKFCRKRLKKTVSYLCKTY